MPQSIDKSSAVRQSRRDLLKAGSLATAMGVLSPVFAKPGPSTAPPTYHPTTNAESTGLYESIGVEPLINCRGTFTIITGSQTLPEVKKAMDEASRNYVQMDELMDGVGKRLAELTGAEWGVVSNGCCSGLTICTCAAVAGTNPERMQRLPDLTGLKNEVIIPEYSRNVYDHAVRMVGVKIIEVNDPAKLESAFNDHTAMVYILAGPGDDGPLGTQAISAVAKRHGVPVIVDAAAEGLTFPNLHLQRGATVVAYSGGKCIRGPQSAGLLLGDKNFLQAAWANAAPHHAFGRSLKVGKEEMMGMMTAVEMWKKRDHDAEWRQWVSWLNQISDSVKRVNGVSTEIIQPEGLSNHTPSLKIQWDGEKLGITGTELSQHLLDSRPRIAFARSSGARPDKMVSTIVVTPYMMMPDNVKVVADRLYQTLSNPPKAEASAPLPEGQPAAVNGQWQVKIEFVRGSADHSLDLVQSGSSLVGTHYGEYGQGDLKGEIAANLIRLRSSQKIQGTRLFYDFTGTVDGDRMSGDVGLGEYGQAKWSAQRHQYASPEGVIRPVKTPTKI